MEQALECAKAFKSARPSSSQVPAPEVSSSEESNDGGISNKQFESLKNQIDSLSTKFEDHKIESHRQSDEMERKINQCHSRITDIMNYLRDCFPPNDP